MSNDNSKIELLDRLRRKDNEAIEKLYKSGIKSCASLVMKDGGTLEDAREVLQEALFSLIIKLENPDFKIKSNVNGYLYRTCFNIWVASKKKARRNISIDASPFEIEDDISDVDFKNNQEQRYKQMYKCLEKISSECQQLLKFTFFEKKSDAEIAPIMNYKVGFVKNKRRRCLKALRTCVEKT